MRARQVELSGLCGLALCVAFAMAPAPALATSLQQAWSVCISMDSDADDRVADCSAVIESGQAKGRQLAYAYVSRGRALDKLDNLPGAIADYGAALRLDLHLGPERDGVHPLARGLGDLDPSGQLRNRRVRLGDDVVDPEGQVDHPAASRRRGRLRADTRAKNPAISARASWPPSNPRHTCRSRPASS